MDAGEKGQTSALPFQGFEVWPTSPGTSHFHWVEDLIGLLMLAVILLEFHAIGALFEGRAVSKV